MASCTTLTFVLTAETKDAQTSNGLTLNDLLLSLTVILNVAAGSDLVYTTLVTTALGEGCQEGVGSRHGLPFLTDRCAPMRTGVSEGILVDGTTKM